MVNALEVGRKRIEEDLKANAGTSDVERALRDIPEVVKHDLDRSVDASRTSAGGGPQSAVGSPQ
jgi:hypothetical protein